MKPVNSSLSSDQGLEPQAKGEGRSGQGSHSIVELLRQDRDRDNFAGTPLGFKDELGQLGNRTSPDLVATQGSIQMTEKPSPQQSEEESKPSDQNQQKPPQPSDHGHKSNGNKQQQDLPAVGEAGKQ